MESNLIPEILCSKKTFPQVKINRISSTDTVIFPVFNLSDFSMISDDYSIILNKIGFHFPFWPKKLQKVIDDNSVTLELKEKFILYTFVSFQQNFNINYLKDIVESLFYLIEYGTNDLGLRAIDFTFFQLTNNPNEFNYNVIFPLFKTFFTKYIKNAMKYQSLL